MWVRRVSGVSPMSLRLPQPVWLMQLRLPRQQERVALLAGLGFGLRQVAMITHLKSGAYAFRWPFALGGGQERGGQLIVKAEKVRESLKAKTKGA